MSGGAGRTRAVLEGVAAAIESARGALAGPVGAKGTAALRELAARLDEAREALAAASRDAEGAPEAERLAVAREAGRIRSALRVAGRLAAGGAAFAERLRDAARPRGGAALYGPGGGGNGSDAGVSLERRA